MGLAVEELAKARADRRAHAWITQRVHEVREERARVAAQFTISEQARDYEQADVDRLTRGVGRFFRALLEHGDLTKEQQELAAAQLVCDELTRELGALDEELEQLERRARPLADADARYAHALAALEAAAHATGDASAELDAIRATEMELDARRTELAETITTALRVQGEFRKIIDLVRELEPADPQSDQGAILGESLLKAIIGRTSRLYGDLCAAVARAQQGLFAWEHACARLIDEILPAGTTALNLELPAVASFVRRDVLWTNAQTYSAILPEIARVSSMLAWRTGELRDHDAALARAQAECARIRARLLDPECGPYR